MLYRNAAFCVFHLLLRSFGLPIIEAFSHGKAMIASTGGALPEVAGEYAPCLDPADTNSWREMISNWIAAPPSAKRTNSALNSRFANQNAARSRIILKPRAARRFRFTAIRERPFRNIRKARRECPRPGGAFAALGTMHAQTFSALDRGLRPRNLALASVSGYICQLIESGQYSELHAYLRQGVRRVLGLKREPSSAGPFGVLSRSTRAMSSSIPKAASLRSKGLFATLITAREFSSASSSLASITARSCVRLSIRRWRKPLPRLKSSWSMTGLRDDPEHCPH